MMINEPLNLEEGHVFVIDKPLNWTSFDVVKKIRNALGIKKVGHAGTLDPLATGVLIVCCGKKTKTIDSLMAQEKEYTGTIKLGATTPSFDAETEEQNIKTLNSVLTADLFRATKQFIGDISQVPPIYSAITVNGQKLYKLARGGQEFEPDPRPVSIYSFEITAVRLPFIDFKVKCSKGTYIRSLAHDYGKALGVGGYLTALRRTASGDFQVDQAWKLDTLVAYIRQATGRTVQRA